SSLPGDPLALHSFPTRRSSDLGEIDMAWRVDQVEHILLAVPRRVMQAYGLRLDRNAALALDLHRIEHLLFHLARIEPAGHLDEADRKSTRLNSSHVKISYAVFC